MEVYGIYLLGKLHLLTKKKKKKKGKRGKLYPKRQGPKKPTEKRHAETTRPLPGPGWGWGGLCALG